MVLQNMRSVTWGERVMSVFYVEAQMVTGRWQRTSGPHATREIARREAIALAWGPARIKEQPEEDER